MYNGDLLKIGNTTIGKLAEYRIGRNKLWKDSDRNMNGDVRAVLIGIFPKIEVNFTYMTQTEMSTITALLDQAFFNVTYFDPRTNTTHTAQYYASDYNVELSSRFRGLYKPFSVNLIPVSKRSY